MSIKKLSTSTIREQRDYANMSTTTGLAWAEIASASVSPTTFTDAQGTWRAYRFTTTGTMTLSRAGYLDMLVVGGGGNGLTVSPFPSTGGGGGGNVRWGMYVIPAGSYTLTVGGGAATGAINTGGTSSFGSIVRAGGGRAPRLTDYDPIDRYLAVSGGGSDGGVVSWEATINNVPGAGQGGTVYGANFYDGISLNYDGTTREYGRGGVIGVDAVAATGSGGREGTYPGADGVVIVRIKIG